MASKIIKEETKDFLLAEYELLREMREKIISRGEERIRFYFSILSGAGALLAFFPQFFHVDRMFYAIIFAILNILLIFGAITFDRFVSGHISARMYTRGMNRIRRYFVDHDKSIAKYLILPITDDTPEFGVIGYTEKKGVSTGNVSMMIFINTILLMLIGLIIVVQFLTLQFVYSLIILAILIFMSIIIHFYYYNRQIKKTNQKISINFPREVDELKKK